MQQIISYNLVCDKFPTVAFVKLIVVFVNAFAIWPRKKRVIAVFLKRGYRWQLKTWLKYVSLTETNDL